MLSLIADTNVLFSFFWKNSYTKVAFPETVLYVPERAFSEIKKHESLIREKSSLSAVEFEKLLAELREEVIVVGVSEYAKQLKSCEEIPDKDDMDFVALALSMDLPLWTNDKALQSQKLVLVVPTRSVMRILARGQPWIFGNDKDEDFLSQVAKAKTFKEELKGMEEAVRLAHRKAFG